MTGFKNLFLFMSIGICVSFQIGCVSKSNRLTVKKPTEGTPNISFDVTSVSYPSVLLFSATGAVTFTLSNTGDAAAEGCTAPTLSGTDAVDMVITTDNCSTNNVAIGGNCTVDVIWNASSPGTKAGTLSRACTGVTATTDVDGIGIEVLYPSLSVTPITRNFGNQINGVNSDIQSFVVSNVGTGSASGCSGATLNGTTPGDFSIVRTTCATTLVNSGTCTIDVQLSGVSVATPMCTLSFPCTYGGTVGSSGDGISATQQTLRGGFTLSYADGGTGGLDLAQPRATALSPDGLFLYAVSFTDGAVEAFSRNASTGALTNLGEMVGVPGGTSIAMAPDGNQVYVTSETNNSVIAYSRNLATGSLALLGEIRDGDTCGAGNCDGLGGASDLVVSPDGRHVYISGATDSGVAAFSREIASGSLTFVSYNLDGAGTATTTVMDGLAGARALAMSADGRHLYVAGETEDAVAIFARTVSTGTLTYVTNIKDGVGGSDGLNGVQDILVSRDGLNLYSAGTTDKAIGAFARDAESGTVTFIGKLTFNESGVDAIDDVTSLAEHPNGMFIITTGTSTGVSASLGIFSRNVSSGSLTYREVIEDNNGAIDGIDGGSHALFSWDGLNMYVAGKMDDDISSFTWNMLKIGEATYERSYVDGDTNIGQMAGASGTAVSADGRSVYVVSATDTSIEVFSRDLETGSLTWLEVFTEGSGGVTGMTGALAVAVSHDGRNVYVAGTDNNAVFNRDNNSGRLTFSTSFTAQVGQGGGAGITASADGRNVYITGATDNSIAQFDRDADTGALSYNTAYTDSNGAPIDGLEGAHSMHISKDAKNLYATGSTDLGLVNFIRDPDTGTLTYDENFIDGIGGVDGLGGASGVVASDDGLFLYVLGNTDDSISTWNRSAANGRLTYSTTVTDATNDGLDGAHSLVLHPNNKFVYITADTDNALTSYSRDPTTGALTYVETHKTNTNAVFYMFAPARISIAPDGNHFYIPAVNSDAASVFDVD